jgi:hypothetical protein
MELMDFKQSDGRVRLHCELCIANNNDGGGRLMHAGDLHNMHRHGHPCHRPRSAIAFETPGIACHIPNRELKLCF